MAVLLYLDSVFRSLFFIYIWHIHRFPMCTDNEAVHCQLSDDCGINDCGINIYLEPINYYVVL